MSPATTLTGAGAAPPRPLAVRAPRALGHPPAHPVLLSGLRASPRDAATPPLVVERRDQAFVEGLLADLAEPGQHGPLRASKIGRAHV